jgi:hypothetical protein
VPRKARTHAGAAAGRRNGRLKAPYPGTLFNSFRIGRGGLIQLALDAGVNFHGRNLDGDSLFAEPNFFLVAVATKLAFHFNTVALARLAVAKELCLNTMPRGATLLAAGGQRGWISEEFLGPEVTTPMRSM